MLVNYFGPRPVSTTSQSDAMSNGQAGMAAAERQVAQASSEIAREPVYQQEREAFLANAQANRGVATEQTGLQVSDVTRQLINLNEGEMAFKANARSIEAAQTMFDSLLAIGTNEGTQRQEEDRR